MTSPVRDIVAGVNNTALKHWLRLQKKTHSAANVDALAILIEKQIDEGKLTKDEFKSAIREIHEYGGKRVFLRKLTDRALFTSREKLETHLADMGIALNPEPVCVSSHTVKPKLIYAHWDNDELRVKYSEKHTFRRADLRHDKIISEERPARIIISVDGKSGLLRVFMDPPGQSHSHLNDSGEVSESAYTEFYLTRAEEICGGSEYFDLYGPTERLVKITPPIFDVRRNRVLDEDNVEGSFHSRTNLRGSRSYRAAVENDSLPCAYKNVYGYWVSARSEGKLLRNIGMQVKTEEAMLKFPAHCVASEVEYAISTITSL